jgi:hypothetical protein
VTEAAEQEGSVDVNIADSATIDVDDMEPVAWNPNEMNSEEFDMLVENIKEVGFIDYPQVVPMVDGSYRIIGGAHRWQAARVLGLKKIPCVLLSHERWTDEDLQKFVTVRLNTLHGRINPEKMVALHREMAAKYGDKAMRRMFAYTDKAGWQKIVKQMKKGMKSAGMPKQAQDKFEEATKDAKTVNDLGHVLNHLFNEYGDTLEYSFMVFDYGGKEHLYIAMSKKTKRVMDRVMEVCRSWGRDVNEVVGEVTEEWLNKAEQIEAEEIDAEIDAS